MRANGGCILFVQPAETDIITVLSIVCNGLYVVLSNEREDSYLLLLVEGLLLEVYFCMNLDLTYDSLYMLFNHFLGIVLGVITQACTSA